ncbi:hypothetical protein FQR65_LT00732 [Abscondita terminalis]|nr:hypothetical protein FQR65_LT00732 [Abscondita terminalis]
MNTIVTKLVVSLLFGLIRFFFGIVPIKVKGCLDKEEDIKKLQRKKRTIEAVVVILQSFGGGVLFATCFLHMMPEVSYRVAELKKFGVLEKDYPYSQLVISLGFFTIYFTEEVCQWFVTRTPKKTYWKEKQTPENINEERVKSAITTGLAFEVNSVDIIPNQKDNFENENKYFPDNFSTELVADTIDQAIQTEIDRSDEESVHNIEANLDLPNDINAEIEDFIEEKVKTQQQILRCIFMITALSMHAIFEGLAIGLQQSVNNIWYLFIAVSIHSATVLYMIGSDVVSSGAAVKTIVIHMCMLSATTPFGVLLGLGITLTTNLDTSAKSFAIVVLEGLSAAKCGVLSKRSISDTSVNEYLTERTCWWNEVCKEEFQSLFRCRCPTWSYCRAPGRYYNAYCSMTATGYIWTQPGWGENS